MSWIEEIPLEVANGELRRIYGAIEDSRGKVSNIMKVHSLNPRAMRHHLALYVHLMFGNSGLTRREREAIAVAVSEANGCNYCVAHHRNALEQTGGSPPAADDSGADGRRRAAAEAYAGKLTALPETMRKDDVDRLREAGFSDDEILDIALVVAYFNFVNRIALGLGVQFSEEEARGYLESGADGP